MSGYDRDVIYLNDADKPESKREPPDIESQLSPCANWLEDIRCGTDLSLLPSKVFCDRLGSLLVGFKLVILIFIEKTK